MTDEKMTGWDDPEDIETGLDNTYLGAGRQLLVALNRYLTEHGPDDVRHQELTHARETLLSAMRQIDWSAMDFAQEAIASGDELFSSRPGEDTLLRYRSPRSKHPAQGEFNF